jgi:hypothetical protein
VTCRDGGLKISEQYGAASRVLLQNRHSSIATTSVLLARSASTSVSPKRPTRLGCRSMQADRSLTRNDQLQNHANSSSCIPPVAHSFAGHIHANDDRVENSSLMSLGCHGLANAFGLSSQGKLRNLSPAEC